MWIFGRPDGPLGKFTPQVCYIVEYGGMGGGGRGGLRPNPNSVVTPVQSSATDWDNQSRNAAIPSVYYYTGQKGSGTGGGSGGGGDGGDFDSRGFNGDELGEGDAGLGAPPGKNIIAKKGLILSSNVYTTNISAPRLELYEFSGNTSIEWTGKFLAPNTGNYKFQIISGDASYVWLGPLAASGYTIANANANNGGFHTATSNEFIVSLSSGSSYDLRIQHSNR